MRSYNRNEPLISIHVPKCGGTSFRQALERWFGQKLWLHYIDEQTNALPPKYHLKRGKLRWLYKPDVCIHGHFNGDRQFGVQDYYPEAKQFITFLRDPFEVALSTYFYMKRWGDSWYRGGENRPISAEYADVNHFVRERMGTSYFAQYMPVRATLSNYREIIDTYFVFIGIVEEMQVSLNRMALRLGKQPIVITTSNQSSRDETIDATLEQEFRQQHELEYAMYDYACQKFSL